MLTSSSTRPDIPVRHHCFAARAEFGAGLARVGGLEDLAAGRRAVVARGLAAGAIGQGFRAVHFVEVGFVGRGKRLRGWDSWTPHPDPPPQGGRGKGPNSGASQ
jgi:hypothetical protein